LAPIMTRAICLAVLMLLPTPIHAQELSFTVHGKVRSVDQNKRRIVVDGHRYYVGQDCHIWQNYDKVSFDSVKADQEVELTYIRYPGGRREAKILKIEKAVDATPVPKGPELFPSTAKPGDTGTLATKNSSGNFQVFQVVGKKDVLIKGDGVTFRLQGYPTEKMVEGKSVDLPGYFKVTGNNTYETSTGATKTVLVIEPVTEDEKRKIENAAQAKVRDAGADGDGQKRENEAGKKLRLAKQLLDYQQVEAAKTRLSQIVKQFPGTKSANEAAKILEKLP
jgi:hypothetical protein